MAVNGLNFLLCSLVALVCCNVGYAAEKNETKSPGVCHLEVPTIDIISENERNSADLRGNASRPGYSKITICCSGYKVAPHTKFYCIPDCPKGCENGNCTAPNVCTCFDGYIKGPDDACVPVCPKGCLNGVCTSKGECSCDEGYALEPNKRFCVHNCTKNCGPGGKCVGPNRCVCESGYRNTTGTCEFYCEKGCGDGKCIGPNRCSCNQNYEFLNDTCVPSCPKGCANGKCTAPNKCTCETGWNLDKTGAVCEAHCTKPCLNGKCVAPDKCECNKGYVQDPKENAGNRCVPYCSEGCPSGVCTAPDLCLCNQGYVKQAKGSNVCIKRVRRANLHLELLPNPMP